MSQVIPVHQINYVHSTPQVCDFWCEKGPNAFIINISSKKHNAGIEMYH